MRFRTTLNFDFERLWNGSRYRQVENDVINYDPFRVRRKWFGELWSLTTKFSCLILTHPRSPLCAVWANAITFGPRDVARSGISTPKWSSQSDLRPRAAARWALPRISSFLFVVQFINLISYYGCNFWVLMTSLTQQNDVTWRMVYRMFLLDSCPIFQAC